MPQQLTAGNAGHLNITLVDDNGDAISATAVSWKLYDAIGSELASGDATSFIPDDTLARVDLTSVQTTIDTPMAAREVILACTTTAGDTVEVREAFLIVSRTPLTVMVNSFQTATEAVLTRAEISRLDAFDGSMKAQQQAAMIEAYRRITRMVFQLPQSYDINNIAYGSRRVPLSRLDEDRFRDLPENFLRALRRAQLIEANSLLEVNTVAQKRKEGVVSETIGEASMFLSNKPYLNLPISRETYEELKSFVRLVIQVARG